MRFARLFSVLCVSLLAALPARAETAGQVLTAIGEAHALRDGRILHLYPGAPIEPGDQVHTGAESYLQIRFTDWGLISLRPRTDFVVDEYVYERAGGGREKAYFSLLNGGVRSITGLIGRRDHANYQLRAPIATIGVRGTHYAILMCRKDCSNPDGSPGEDGLYGEVAEGRIAVSPYGGGALAREFGAGERFRLADENSVPTPLFALPSFFPSPLDPQTRSSGAVSPIASVVPGVGSGVTSPNPVASVTGGLGSAAPLAGLVITPIENQVVLPAAWLAGSAVNTLFAMPTLGVVAPLAGPPLNAVPVVVTPVLRTVGPAVNTIVPVVPPVTTPTLPVTTPTLPVTTPTLPVTTPALPVTTPTLPVTTPTLPVTTPTLPVTTPALPVTTPTLPVTTPALPATTPALPVTTPTLPSLPLSAVSPLRR